MDRKRLRPEFLSGYSLNRLIVPLDGAYPSSPLLLLLYFRFFKMLTFSVPLVLPGDGTASIWMQQAPAPWFSILHYILLPWGSSFLCIAE